MLLDDERFEYALWFFFGAFNNDAEYEELIVQGQRLKLANTHTILAYHQPGLWQILSINEERMVTYLATVRSLFSSFWKWEIR